jgi:hypothetical protein
MVFEDSHKPENLYLFEQMVPYVILTHTINMIEDIKDHVYRNYQSYYKVKCVPVIIEIIQPLSYEFYQLLYYKKQGENFI